MCWRPRTWCFKARRPTMSTSTHPRQNAGLPTSVLRLVRLIARRSGGRSPIRSALQNKYPPPRHASTDGTTSEWCLEGEVESAADISFVGSGEYYTRTLSLISPRSGGRSPISSRRLDGDSLIPSQLALDEGSPRQVPLGQSASRVRFSLGGASASLQMVD